MFDVESKGEDTAEREVEVGGRELIGCYLQRVSSAAHVTSTSTSSSVKSQTLNFVKNKK